ncbi:unnamed protein product [Amoebophrya sp. A120]|nr:unnamed protein product [Amoebophrya sp. A120]|eukprot:GSA120T00016807001.1
MPQAAYLGHLLSLLVHLSSCFFGPLLLYFPIVPPANGLDLLARGPPPRPAGAPPTPRAHGRSVSPGMRSVATTATSLSPSRRQLSGLLTGTPRAGGQPLLHPAIASPGHLAGPRSFVRAQDSSSTPGGATSGFGLVGPLVGGGTSTPRSGLIGTRSTNGTILTPVSHYGGGLSRLAQPSLSTTPRAAPAGGATGYYSGDDQVVPYGYGDPVIWGFTHSGIVVGKPVLDRNNRVALHVRYSDPVMGDSHLGLVPVADLRRA